MPPDSLQKRDMTYSIGRYVFAVPETIKDAISRKRELEVQINDINFQLSDKQRKDSNGQLLSRHDYYRWVRSAKAAKIQREAELKYLKDWIREKRDEDFHLLLLAYSALDQIIMDPTSPHRNDAELKAVHTKLGERVGEE